MILTRSPLRITLGGGGTDFPGYYREHGGLVLTAAIDKHVYVALQPNFDPGLIVKYSEVERVARVGEIKHPLIRESMKYAGVEGDLEIVSMADVPAGTGLGSSGAFTTALLAALQSYTRESASKDALAYWASHIEMERVGEPVGKQDTYAAAYGGIQSFRFSGIDDVEAEPLKLSEETLHSLSDGLMLFFTGAKRSASKVLSEGRPDVEALHKSKHQAIAARHALVTDDLAFFASILDESWQEKRKTLSTPEIDDMYCLGRRNGAQGGKLVGAGRGGFMMFYTSDRPRLRRAMIAAGYRELPFAFDFNGTSRVI